MPGLNEISCVDVGFAMEILRVGVIKIYAAKFKGHTLIRGTGCSREWRHNEKN